MAADGFGWGGWAAGILLLGWFLRTLRWLWWTPRSTERKLRAQGIGGTSYRLLFGDLRETLRLTREAKSKPMPLSHDIIPRVLPFHQQIVKTYGKVSMSWFGVSPRVIIADPILIREVLLNKSGQIGKPKPGPPAQLITRGLVSYDGEEWAMHRKIINPAFHVEKLKRMLPAFSYSCEELVRRWESLFSSEGSCEVDVWPELQNFTRDVISRAAFGSSFKVGRRIFQLQDEQAKLVVQSLQNFQIPGYRFLPTKRNRRMREIDRETKRLLRGIITRREKALQQAAQGAGDDDLLGLLLRSNQAGVQDDGSSRRAPRMTTEEMIEECQLFYLAGQETTSILLTWAMVALGMHPNWQDRARVEVLQVFGREKPDFDRLSQLKIVGNLLPSSSPPCLIIFQVQAGDPSLSFSLVAGDDDSPRGAPAVPTGAVPLPEHPRGDDGWRVQLAGGVAAPVGHPAGPARSGVLGGRRRRFQPGEVRRGGLQGIEEPVAGGGDGLLALRRRASRLRRPGLRLGGGEDGSRLHPPELLLRALPGVHPCAEHRHNPPAAARRPGHLAPPLIP